MKFVEHKTSVATKKGNNEGIIEFVQINKPFLAASKLDFENKTRDNIKNKIKNIDKNFLKESTKIFI